MHYDFDLGQPTTVKEVIEDLHKRLLALEAAASLATPAAPPIAQEIGDAPSP